MINYDGRRFHPEGEPDQVAIYRQDGDLLWGEFTGGTARRGTLVGICAPDGVLDFAYCMVLADGEVVSGRCHSTPTLRPGGRVILREEWERYGPHAGMGLSTLEEVDT